ncbi:MAG: NAD(P)/FAD-dependent oxidoreductase [Thermoplasmatales archaeon]|nr:NAD(P)/FAD-dependent oxidoreductase [Thermoplasmatales archaeon]
MKNLFDCIVVGGGPAGCAAAIHLKRSGFDVLVIEKEKIGGSLIDANIIENIPGFPDGIRGCILAKKFEEHLLQNGVKFIFDEVLKIKIGEENFNVICKEKRYKSRSLIVAIGLVNVGKKSKNIYTRARDLNDYDKKVIAILGLGDAAFDAALRFSSASRIYLIGRKIKAIEDIVKKVKKMKNVEIFECNNAKIIKKNDKILIKILPNDKIIEVDKILICYGKRRDKSILPKNIRVRKNSTEVYPGLFIAGDFAMPETRYIPIALATGIMAAQGVIKYLRGEK